jgi:hypothetical protein
MGKPEGKRQLGRSRLRCEDNIKADILEVGCGGIDWIELAKDRVNVVMNLQEFDVKMYECVSQIFIWNDEAL